MGRVRLDELSLENFRNIARAKIDPGPRFNVFSGGNGSGKTSLAEAVYLLGALRSFRTSSREELVRYGTDHAAVGGLFGDVNTGRKVEVEIGAAGRKVRSDGKPVRLDGAHFGAVPMVLFHPGMMELVQGGPDARRRFLDRALFQAEPSYPAHHRAYARALASRNRLLKEPRPDRAAIAPFSAQLAEHGSRIVELRARFVEAMGALFREVVGKVSDGRRGALVYEPKAAGSAGDMLFAIEAASSKDLARGFTAVGPHADELSFLLDDKDARRFASQGQQRTTVLAAKIAETMALSAATGRIPLLLLDDVSSELDRAHNARLFRHLADIGGQVLITTTHPDHVTIEGERRDFTVVDGAFSPARLSSRGER